VLEATSKVKMNQIYYNKTREVKDIGGILQGGSC